MPHKLIHSQSYADLSHIMLVNLWIFLHLISATVVLHWAWPAAHCPWGPAPWGWVPAHGKLEMGTCRLGMGTCSWGLGNGDLPPGDVDLPPGDEYMRMGISSLGMGTCSWGPPPGRWAPWGLVPGSCPWGHALRGSEINGEQTITNHSLGVMVPLPIPLALMPPTP